MYGKKIMITDADVEKLKKTFATKDGVKEDLRVLKEDLLDQMDKQMDQKLEKLKKDIIGAVADIIQEGINPILDNHEERITSLEKRTPAIA